MPQPILIRRGPSLAQMADHAARLERRKGLRLFARKQNDAASAAFATARSYDRIEACANAPDLVFESGPAPAWAGLPAEN